MIDSAQPLAELHDIVAAPAASWWPLAPAWYVLIVLAMVALVTSAIALNRYYQHRRVRRAALRALRQPASNFNAITLVLKQACLGYFDANHVASLSGAAWFGFLLQQLPRRTQPQQRALLQQLQQSAYQPTSNVSCEQYQQLARYWLRHALPPSKASKDARA
ncbi:DUF4381 domain-containing protein [Pseudidiomarina mangrovi]|uniref:DUF4381 domain-containing protein n=1 Tax=Pseudidiomarina mangrovi TaxID=2487133 RepID=UPI0013DF2157|nr:DUF4381 domain-containing protein [Pseudidiomarina mangrovi]